jgi:tetratricopeptide (TPR) repeat protein
VTETQTLSNRREQAQAAIEETSARLEELADAHAGLSLAAFEGDKEAIARVEQIDEEIAEAERRRRLAEDALSEISVLEKEAEAAAREARHRELVGEYDNLVGERAKALKRFEKALDSLQNACDAVLEVDDERQREIGADLGLTDGHIAPYNLTLRDRILTKLPGLLGVGPTTLYPEPLTEDTGVFTETIAEAATRCEESMKRREESRVEEQRIRAVVERREKIMLRRDELRAQAGYATAHPVQRPEIEAQVEGWIAEEFPEENSEVVKEASK